MERLRPGWPDAVVRSCRRQRRGGVVSWKDEDTAEAARQRRARRVGGGLFLCVVLAAMAVAWNDLRVRREAGERYVQALADSHARQLAQEIDSIELAFRGVGDAIGVVRELAPEAAADQLREAVTTAAVRHRRVGAIRADSDAPAFVPAGSVRPGQLYIG